ncbi:MULTISPECIES: Ger(x)C family spore germination protein [unclassified Sporosarcina]|uniref:Ger(x)C family spore germination protein n=1 Tax=unclassified Sporosarcina TaxID=2647733 RepID=UPI002040A2F0|nr:MULTISPECIES: Ger(x)C family spore germination protein [unclassified Sporosarcina]GKV65331.1 hypothetical protein NCCP2331_14840 [Sporosarcina sp. NCCP-2331]GLB55455.1 hypothetical protein NCCP2378_12420 [Sporosarcina sp. NCCP-2378]
MEHKSSFAIKLFGMVFMLSTVILLSGCAFKDIDKRLFVSAIGVDPAANGEEGYKVTLKVALPFGAIKETTKPNFTYLSKEGESIGEIIRMLETHADKVLEFGHMKTIVIHEDLLTDHMKTFMDYFIRRGDIQFIAYVAGAKSSAEEILKVQPDTEAPASVSMFNFFGTDGTESPYITTTYLFQFRRDFFTEGLNAVLPLIETNKDQTELIVNKTIVVDKKKDPLTLDHDETKYYNTLFRGANGFSYKVKNGDKRLLLNISRVKMNYQIITNNNVPQAIDMDVKMVGVIGESDKTLSIAKLDEYNHFASKEVKKKILGLLNRMQEHQVDPFGFGLHYRATRLSHDHLAETWRQAYPDLKFNVNVEVKLQSTGTIQ